MWTVYVELSHLTGKQQKTAAHPCLSQGLEMKDTESRDQGDDAPISKAVRRTVFDLEGGVDTALALWGCKHNCAQCYSDCVLEAKA